MRTFLYNLYTIIRALAVIAFFAGTLWISKHPVECGKWYGDFMEGQIYSFNTR